MRYKKVYSQDPQNTLNNEKHYYQIGENIFDEEIIDYAQTVTSLIEERYVSLNEVLSMLRKKVRQHSMDKHEKGNYACNHLSGDPP